MSDYIYSSPEKYGLRTIGELDFSSGSYEFDLTVVWQDVETGALYYADDSGCSCPYPFESTGRADLVLINRLQELIDHLAKRKDETYGDYVSEGDIAALIQAYRKARA